ncbi:MULTISPECIES: sensor histidine kinase RegB [unclassified Ruegeria]|uniref:sensor histidine kinase RegB n=1 Tax=unclassified Ruegeria TaxID=2625375 RepID=UPI001489324B|nr:MULTISPECIES: ActS/PrrB/RegB family redox-sensitive histidine kinase [unclassified Ruegeria]NOD33391.1 ActS/PrrB/RegB family redox-sensitive histidine kinase [Ruegeria sp. HKCCD7296]NOD48548.1 ActS/PrrB/RegB family redox-sensitive histidine kinase [Ruegeria sp. HKCCD5849]NOD52150.1 ActS/PrrB/RegB family redox-sensitive histidine kinase [Ruegeria sp. HKCCD5851]NOD66808.1 ActS/PrrB/RegB family redox-sensitive histidine kinase [Ruegeria sp. HKCCD7303]NOE33710.1 ActS/PrrB/RegB family redox-sens
MAESNQTFWRGQERSSWIRLRTLILLRWVAIIGQFTAITVAQQYYDVQLQLGLCYLAIGISVMGNLTAILLFPQNKRLTEFENFLMVLFDLLQLSILLYLTGGLNNPFALLLLGPVTISANVMSTRSTLIVGAVAIVLTTLLAEFHLPLRTSLGLVLDIPDILLFGNWAAIVIAIVFIGAYSHRVSSEVQSMSEALAATHMALAREQKLTDLGGVVAAAAHELGTPLATIKLTSAELIEELDDHPDLKEDAALIREQADRCRDILRDMGRAGKDDLHLRQAPLSTVVNEAAEPHVGRGKEVHFSEGPALDGDVQQPSILRKPEIIHGLRNLIQNAVDFARANVWVEAEWTDTVITVSIMDDGRGYPSHMIGRIGDPFMRRRRADADKKARPEYEGMGLGLFIAKTLLERSGAELEFANGADPYQNLTDDPARKGAIVKVSWPRKLIDAQKGDTPVPSGLNERIQV